MENGKKMPRNHQLSIRILSALVMLPIALTSIVMGGWAFGLLLIFCSFWMAIEWYAMTMRSRHAIAIRMHLEARSYRHMLGWGVLGILYIAVPILSLFILRALPHGLANVLWLSLVIWSTDSGAYAAGRTIGGKRIAPSISPSKTWSGLCGGVLVAAFTGWLCASLFFTAQHPWLLVLWSALLAIVAQAGDFLESAIKRYFHVKDSGTLIPGHGGLLDRIDGYTFVSPTVLIMVLMTPGGLFV